MKTETEQFEMPLFAPPPEAKLHRPTDLETSKEAARSVLDHLTDIQDRVRVVLGRYGPMTDDELLIHFPAYSPSTIRTRRSELKEQGIVINKGTKKNARGRTTTIWDIKRA